MTTPPTPATAPASLALPDVQVAPGASVDARDGRLGTVDEVFVRPQTGEIAYLVVRRGWTDHQITVPADLIESIPSQREVRLRATREEAEARAAGRPAPDIDVAHGNGAEIRIPILEERLVTGTRPVDLGELRIHKFVDEVEEAVRQPVRRDDLVMERVPLGRPIEAPMEMRTEGEWLVIPIMEEVLVVQKRLILKEEIRIRKQDVLEDVEVRQTVRRERVEVEDATVYGVHGLPPQESVPPPESQTKSEE